MSKRKKLSPGASLYNLSGRQEIEFKVSGLPIFGSLNFPKNLKAGEQVPCVIDVHGWKGSRKGKKKFMLGVELMKAGWAYFRFDLPGHNFSDGNIQKVSLGLFSRAIQKAMTALAKHPNIDPNRFALIGTSVGGSAAIMTAARDSRVKALVLWAPRSDYHDTAPNLYYVVDRSIVNHRIRRSGLRYDFYKAIGKFNGPVLIIHGQNDQFVNYTQSERLHQAVRSKKLFISPHVNHTFNGAEEAVVQITAEWFIKESGLG